MDGSKNKGTNKKKGASSFIRLKEALSNEEMGPLLSGASYRNHSGCWGASWEGVHSATLEGPAVSHSTSRHAVPLMITMTFTVIVVIMMIIV